MVAGRFAFTKNRRSERLEVQYAEEFRNIDTLCCKAAAEHTVGAGHQLDAQSLHIGVQNASGQEYGFTGIKADQIQVKRRNYRGISGEKFSEH